MKWTYILVLCIGAGFILLVIILKTILAQLRQSLRQEVSQRYPEHQILIQSLGANFFSQKSKGGTHIRGNGALVLTVEELWFLLAVPRREITIPLADIRAVSLTRSHLNKRAFRPLLTLEYNTVDGPDVVSWLVEQPEKWIQLLEEQLEQDQNLQ
ncbi:hypothetical protein ACFL27_27240 [candidate division CSSED10-310 bacterium]|uniref:Uncharacterized protein n=1 Tax=candidate division CSSED10-310 bacterium TaxID=2855610 RepID=A0ABV6Z617_UNCC1